MNVCLDLELEFLNELVARSYSPSFEAEYSLQKSLSSSHTPNTEGFNEKSPYYTQVLIACVGSVGMGQGL